MTINYIKFKPLVTEKSSLALSDNKFTFIVDNSTNKIEFSQFIANTFNVKVTSANVVNLKGKKRRRGKIVGKTKDIKKMTLTIDSNSKVDKIKELF